MNVQMTTLTAASLFSVAQSIPFVDPWFAAMKDMGQLTILALFLVYLFKSYLPSRDKAHIEQIDGMRKDHIRQIELMQSRFSEQVLSMQASNSQDQKDQRVDFLADRDRSNKSLDGIALSLKELAIVITNHELKMDRKHVQDDEWRRTHDTSAQPAKPC